MRFNEHCFLDQPSWRALLESPCSSSQSQSLNLRTAFCKILFPLPSLVILITKYLTETNPEICDPLVSQQESQRLLLPALTMRGDLLNWLNQEASEIRMPPHFLTIEETGRSLTSHSQLQEQEIGNSYRDIIYGVLDCVANTTLLSIDKLLRRLLLFQAGFRPNTQERRIPQSQDLVVPNRQFLDTEKTIECRRKRALTAFNFVKAKSPLAAKPLEFGVKQIQSGGTR